jgi:hypothetical protein
LGKAIRNVGNHQPLSIQQTYVNVSSGGIVWQCYAYLHVFQRSSAFGVIATVIWLSGYHDEDDICRKP